MYLAIVTEKVRLIVNIIITLVTTAFHVFLVVNIHGWSLRYIFRTFDIEPSFSNLKYCSIIPVQLWASFVQVRDNAVSGYGLLV